MLHTYIAQESFSDTNLSMEVKRKLHTYLEQKSFSYINMARSMHDTYLPQESFSDTNEE